MKYIRLVAFCLFALSAMSFTKSNIIETKVLTEQFMVNPESHFKIGNDNGPIEFRKTDDVEARIEATLTVEGESKAELQKVMDQFKILVNVSNKVIDVEAVTNIRKWEQFNVLFYNKNTMEFKDGTQASDIESAKVSVVVYLPKVKELSITNKYDKVSFDSFDCNVNAEMMSSDFIGGNINGDVDLNLRYGTMSIGNVENAQIELFDSEAEFGECKDLNLNSRYSEIKFKNVKVLDQLSFDDEIEFGAVQESVKLNARYSDIKFQDFDTGVFEIFESEIIAGEAKSLSVNSRYSDYTLKNLESLEIQSFEDEYNLGTVDKVKLKSSRYSSYKFSGIENTLIVNASFEDDITVSQVGANISNLELDGRYTDLDFPIPSGVAYHLEAKINYGSLEYPEVANVKSKSGGDEKFEIVSEVNNPNDGSLKIKIKSFEGVIDIKN